MRAKSEAVMAPFSIRSLASSVGASSPNALDWAASNNRKKSEQTDFIFPSSWVVDRSHSNSIEIQTSLYCKSLVAIIRLHESNATLGRTTVSTKRRSPCPWQPELCDKLSPPRLPDTGNLSHCALKMPLCSSTSAWPASCISSCRDHLRREY